MSASQAKHNTETTEKSCSLTESLLCPACNDPQASLLKQSSQLVCNGCGKQYPLFTCNEVEIPWLYSQPEIQLLEWQARLKGFLHLNQSEQNKLKAGLNDKRLSKTSQKRLRNLLNARKQQQEQILQLLQPLNLNNDSITTPNALDALHTKTPKVQGLESYYNNIFRDWSWENDENDQMLAAVNSVLDDETHLGKILTIGSGAGRLSYDLHQT